MPNDNNGAPASSTLGQIAYEAYFDSLGGVSGVTGHALPSWDSGKVTDQIKAGWQAAADAVIAAQPASAVSKAA